MAFPTTGILDNFNRANEDPLANSTWTKITGSQNLKIVSNICQGSPFNQLSGAYWSATTFGPDSEAYVTVLVIPGGANYVRLYARLTSPGGAQNSYFMQFSNDSNGCRIFIESGGTPTAIAQDAAARYVANDVLGFEVIGSTLTVYKNGASVLSTTDATFSAAGFIGLGARQSTAQLDDFGGGTVVPAAAAFVPKVLVF